MGVNLDTSKGRSQESGVRSQESGGKKKEERRKFFYSLFPVPCSRTTRLNLILSCMACTKSL
ncbi:hypothetical protein [Anabaena sp. AL09]|uniref:hypothetical protein n=1 Tax=Anabaena sp. AL09 TaxID=1710891 RepID=UPI000B044E88|nr:hypothetical protein [Anabaena sp. AL09]